MIGDAQQPHALDYISAVQSPERSFLASELRGARFEVNKFGTVTSAQGRTAIVFFAEMDQQPIAVRCLMRPIANGAERYHRLSEFVRRCPVEPLVRAEWLDLGILVRDQIWPVIRMEQVRGVTLARYVDEHVGRPGAIRLLSENWRQAVAALSAAGIVHGDLQQDNVMITYEGEVRLVDLDWIWLPGMGDLVPDERGHRNFQHPMRVATGHWHRGIDTFAALVIYLSLRALAVDATLWSFHLGENLILVDTDFIRPGSSPIWLRLLDSPDPQVRDLAMALMDLCGGSGEIQMDLTEILRRVRISSELREKI